MTVTQTFDIKFEIDGHPNYGVTTEGEIFNLKRGTKLKKTVVGTTAGYCLDGKFKSLAAIRPKLRKRRYYEVPF